MTARDATQAPKGVVLGADERREFGQRADSLLPNQLVYSLTSVEAIARARLAAERAAHEGLRDTIEVLADDLSRGGNPLVVSAQLRAAIAAGVRGE